MGNKNEPKPQNQQCDHSWSNWDEEIVSEDRVRFVRHCTKCWKQETQG
ncbi:MAG TPA: hypothetical protein VHJ17_25690 [Thermomonospora sp.]|nr:hypothetical protein [Thermomonospora sp.]